MPTWPGMSVRALAAARKGPVLKWLYVSTLMLCCGAGLRIGQASCKPRYASPLRDRNSSYSDEYTLDKLQVTPFGAISRPGETIFFSQRLPANTARRLATVSCNIYRLGYYEQTHGRLVLLPQPSRLSQEDETEIPGVSGTAYIESYKFRNDPITKWNDWLTIPRVGAYLVTYTWGVEYLTSRFVITSEPVLVIVEPRNSAGEFDITLVREAATRSFGSDAEWQEIQVMLGIEQPNQMPLQSDYIIIEPARD